MLLHQVREMAASSIFLSAPNTVMSAGPDAICAFSRAQAPCCSSAATCCGSRSPLACQPLGYNIPTYRKARSFHGGLGQCMPPLPPGPFALHIARNPDDPRESQSWPEARSRLGIPVEVAVPLCNPGTNSNPNSNPDPNPNPNPNPIPNPNPNPIPNPNFRDNLCEDLARTPQPMANH